MRKNHRACIWVAGLGMLAASAALAAGREVALGADGEVYTVRAGQYGDLFPKGRDFEPGNSVVALDVSRPGAPLQRMLVPGTGGSEAETSPSVLFEEDSQTAYLLWETKKSSIHPILQIAGFDGASWSRTIEVIGNPFAAKTSPQFTITRDSYEEPGPDNSTVSRHLLVLHVMWQEETSSGAWVTLYSPILIDEGGAGSWNPVYNLDEYLRDHVTPTAGDIQTALLHAPLVETGRDARTILVAYASAATGRLAVIEVDVLPQQLIQLADKARMHIVDLGHGLYPSNMATLAAKARMHIVDLGQSFRPDVIQAIAKDVQEQILAGGADGLEPLANKARMHIVDLGAQLSGRGLRSAKGADATAQLVEISPDDTGSPETRRPFLFQLRVVSDLPVPAVGAGAVRLFASEQGENLIVSWAQADKVVYCNSRDAGWTDPRELRLSDNLDLAKAYEVLEQRLRNR
jgi:hypothetical protein